MSYTTPIAKYSQNPIWNYHTLIEAKKPTSYVHFYVYAMPCRSTITIPMQSMSCSPTPKSNSENSWQGQIHSINWGWWTRSKNPSTPFFSYSTTMPIQLTSTCLSEKELRSCSELSTIPQQTSTSLANTDRPHLIFLRSWERTLFDTAQSTIALDAS